MPEGDWYLSAIGAVNRQHPLLSTLVQSGATLVAIIAGLLVARLVALVGERVALERRIKELREIKIQRQSELDTVRQTRLDEDADDFIESIFDSYFGDTNKPFEEFYREWDSDSRTADELRPYFDRFVCRVWQLFEQLDCAGLAKRDNLLTGTRSGLPLWSSSARRKIGESQKSF